MIKGGIFMGIIAVLLLGHQQGMSQESPKVIQEEESSEVFLEEYTDEFEETFFEALKQKGIQNYDRAINLLLECKQLQPENGTLDHELAKVYFLDKRYIPAQQYAIEALNSAPGNYWFLDNLIRIVDKQGIPFTTLKGNIPYQNETLRGNLAKIYFLRGNYPAANAVLKDLPKTKALSHLADKIKDSMGKAQRAVPIEKPSNANMSFGNTELENLRTVLKSLANDTDYKDLEAKANEALEAFPLQPEFYYYRGLALNQLNRSSEAVEVLEEGLGYLFEENQLTNDFFKELAKAYKAVGNSSKANEYFSKLKPGF